MNRTTRTRRTVLAMIASFPLVALVPSTYAQTTLLDGKVFVGAVGEKGKPLVDKDVISFADGKFHSSVCDQYGFDRGPYQARAVADAIEFEVETTSNDDGRLAWRGTVKGDVLEGTFVHYRPSRWYRPNPAPLEHWFRAALKK